MNAIFNKNTFLIKEKMGIFKAANNYDIFDATNNQMILKCVEPNLGFFTKMFRFTDYKRMTPFDVHTMEGVNSEMILGKMKNKNKQVLNKEELLESIKNNKTELLITAGAGDIDTLVDPIKKILTTEGSGK